MVIRDDKNLLPVTPSSMADDQEERLQETCSSCKRTIIDSETKMLMGILVCDDCFIDALMPKMPKAHYANGAEFMNRLKDSFTAFPQQYH